MANYSSDRNTTHKDGHAKTHTNVRKRFNLFAVLFNYFNHVFYIFIPKRTPEHTQEH